MVKSVYKVGAVSLSNLYGSLLEYVGRLMLLLTRLGVYQLADEIFFLCILHSTLVITIKCIHNRKELKYICGQVHDNMLCLKTRKLKII